MNVSVLNPRRFFRRSDRVQPQRQTSVETPRLPNVQHPKYKDERERLKTFDSRWPANHIDHYQLALTGMFFMGLRDCVQCYFCGVTITDWRYGDDPVEEHLKFSPTCPLLRRKLTDNMPINSAQLDQILPLNSPDECGGACLGPNTVCPIPQKGPTFPHYASEDARKDSFTEWPRATKFKVPQFVDAGFFYTGRSDHVQCFSCGITIKDWEEDTDPWYEHAAQQPTCKFLKLMRSKEFIEERVEKHEMKKIFSEPMEIPKSFYDRQISTASSLGCGGGATDIEYNICKICSQEERNVVFLPCGHVVACAKCATSVDRCPICRLPFTDVTRIYFS